MPGNSEGVEVEEEEDEFPTGGPVAFYYDVSS